MKKVNQISLVLAAVFCLAGLSACANAADSFGSSESVGKMEFSGKTVECYKFENVFTDEAWEDGTSWGKAFICENLDNNFNYKYWKYFVQYQVSYSSAADQAESEDKASGWAVRRVYCKSRTDSLKVYSDIKKNMNKKLGYKTTFEQHYGIDYDVEALMKTPAVSLVVNNVDGDAFKKNEIMYDYDDDNGVNRKVYENRTLFYYSQLADGTYKNAFLVCQDSNESAVNYGYNYVVYFHINYWDTKGEWVSCVEREVLCTKKSETKKVLKDILTYYAEDPDRLVSLAPGEWMYQCYDSNYSLTALLADKDKK